MNRRPILGLTLTILLAATPAAEATAQVSIQAANSQPKPNDAFVDVHDFVFGDGESLASLKLHYLTLGKPRRDASGAINNAVLLLHGTAGSAADLVTADFFDALYGAGQPLDLGRYFLVIPDAIGAGDSSKPSDGLHAQFPHFGYKDQVRADHQMLEQMGIKHLKLVLGTSVRQSSPTLWAGTGVSGSRLPAPSESPLSRSSACPGKSSPARHFDLEEEHRVFETQGVKANAAMQLEREDVILSKGAGFEVVARLLALNDPGTAPYVEVILLSQNSPDLSLRAFKSINHYGLTVKTGSFTSGRSLSPFVPAWALTFFCQTWIRT